MTKIWSKMIKKNMVKNARKKMKNVDKNNLIYVYQPVIEGDQVILHPNNWWGLGDQWSRNNIWTYVSQTHEKSAYSASLCSCA